MTALDGLRGVAAVVVLLWHATLATRFGDSILGQISGWPAPPRDGVGHLLFDTPLRVLTMGTAAVTVFFVLSGVVLVLPLLRDGFDLWAYYPRRLLRLWVPCAASVVFALLLMNVVTQKPENAVSRWAENYTFPDLNPTTAVSAFFVITGDPRYNNPLWSLKWEMLFSLMLPVIALIVVSLRRHAGAALLACAAVSGCGAALHVDELQYAPIFLAGGLTAVSVAERPTARDLASWARVVGGIVLISVPEMHRTLFDGLMSGTAGLAATGFVVLGATLLVRGLAAPSSAGRLFESRPAQFLGRISFSLYLVHVPIILTLLNVLPGHPARAVAISIPVSLLVAALFARFVEEPSASLAKRAGVRASTWAAGIARR